ncbi:hypothetical protein Anapl_07977 [Anas platyrhynchos]|uniref:Uncharacterized protein n=1 Tax=Anas platyrhynchos TaxID=8839 RepID=R0JL80_ANAPL|nr:hypothetical protein Anapl_07977 [Anas platyrhynchos]
MLVVLLTQAGDTSSISPRKWVLAAQTALGPFVLPGGTSSDATCRATSSSNAIHCMYSMSASIMPLQVVEEKKAPCLVGTDHTLASSFGCSTAAKGQPEGVPVHNPASKLSPQAVPLQAGISPPQPTITTDCAVKGAKQGRCHPEDSGLKFRLMPQQHTHNDVDSACRSLFKLLEYSDIWTIQAPINQVMIMRDKHQAHHGQQSEQGACRGQGRPRNRNGTKFPVAYICPDSFLISASSSVRKLQKFSLHHAGVKSSIKGDLKIVPRVASSELPQLQASPCTWSASTHCHSSGAGFLKFVVDFYQRCTRADNDYKDHRSPALADRGYKCGASTHCSVPVGVYGRLWVSSKLTPVWSTAKSGGVQEHRLQYNITQRSTAPQLTRRALMIPTLRTPSCGAPVLQISAKRH